MFGPSYDGALPTERVKYGCLNTTGDSYRGVDSAAGYGDSYLILKSEVRRRCTFTECDSAFSLCAVGVADAYAHVLVKFVDADLASILDVGGSSSDIVRRVKSGYAKSTAMYREVCLWLLYLCPALLALACVPRLASRPLLPPLARLASSPPPPPRFASLHSASLCFASRCFAVRRSRSTATLTWHTTWKRSCSTLSTREVHP